MPKLTVNDYIQGVIALVLLGNLIYFWYQVDLTKELNQPVCAVKGIEWKVIPVESKGNKIDVVSFAAILMNSGNYAATDTTVSWKWYSIQDGKRYETSLKDEQKIRKFVLPPKQEVAWNLFYEQAEKTKERILGYEKYDEVEILVEWRDIKKELRQYSCVYRIMRLLSPELNVYETILIGSTTNVHGGGHAMQPWKWLLILGLVSSCAGLILMIQARMYTNENGVKGCVPMIQRPVADKLGWVLTISGYILQIIGVVIT